MRDNKRIYKLCFIAVLTALSALLAFLESSLPPMVATLPGIKIGLSNIPVMYCTLCVGYKEGYILGIAKSLFILITLGPGTAFFSILGGMVSITAVTLTDVISRKKASYYLISIIGAVFHNLGQSAAAYFYGMGKAVIFYIPVLIIGGIICGAVTAVLLKVLLPLLSKYRKYF